MPWPPSAACNIDPLSVSLYLIVFAVVSAVVSLLLLSRLATLVGLVDIPNTRKSHIGHIPVVGGLALVVSLCATTVVFDLNWPFNPVLSLLGLVLFTFGLVDDKVGLTPKLRILVQLSVALLSVFVGDLHLYYFGDIFGYGDFYLGFWGEFLTVLAIVTAVNAFNMIDGIDGLLALLLVNVFAAMALADPGLTPLYLVFICSLLVFLVFNLGLFSTKNTNRKVFMGDAGSMMFGYLVVCLLIDKSQHPGIVIRPVTVLWIIAIPLMDLVAIVIRRNRKKQPVMKADRDHLHHIFMRMGFSERSALLVIISIAALFCAIGLASEHYQINESIMFTAFLAVFSVYLYFILHAWRFIRLFNVLKRRR
ncbi:MAG: undecaprenyl-phosphate alpha-N-acetylglucosaminyl 1-phosphate transferase [Algicola sp.]|nr:undecaprenyl-phosphate alpha-N-acetylglucosaminyl 1-phosphate transferase [Algicola sp.]